MKMLLRNVSMLTCVVTVVAIGGCRDIGQTLNPTQTYTQGHVMDSQTMEWVQPGSSREQVLLALGTPSTTATYDNEVFYYISQKRVRRAAFMNPKVVSQRVVAVYFGADERVERVADYGLKDGKVFDFISRTTPTGGKDQSFLGTVVAGVRSGGPPPSAGNVPR